MEGQLVPLLSFAGITSASCAVLLGLRGLLVPQRTAAEPGGVPRLPRHAETAGAAGVGRFDAWFERTLYRSGWPLNPQAGMLLHLIASVSLGGLVLLWTDNPLVAGLSGLAGGAGVLTALVVAERRRVGKFLEQFPDALHLLARAVRAGESLEQAVALVAKSSREPLAAEFHRCHGQLEMGLSVSATLQGLTRRMDLVDVRIFADTLSMHRDVGGNLAATLDRLADVIRDRRAYQRQLKSVTGAGRFSAMFMAALGPLLFAYMFLIEPDYGRQLLADRLGKLLLAYAVMSELVGLFWVSRLVKSEL